VIYGETPTCADEDKPPAPISPYGSCKAAAETLVAQSGLRAVTLRPANIYGPRQRTDLEGGVVAIFMRLWRERRPVTIRGDGSMERDYVFVGDVARAVVAALRSPRRGVYNVGTGVATSINVLVAAMTAVLGSPPALEHVPEQRGELHRSCLDITRAAAELDWKPTTSLEEGIRIAAAAV
jgi:UDP-glucose 4-epimerase